MGETSYSESKGEIVEIYRQGDVLLIKVKRLPMEATEENSGRVMLAGKELPAKNVKAWSAGAERFVRVMQQTALTHETHAPVTLDSGVYKIVPQGRYSPKEIREIFSGSQTRMSPAKSAAKTFATSGYKKAA